MIGINYVMDQNEMCRLIIARNQKLRALREQAANENQNIKRLFMGSIKYLLSDQKAQQQAYEQISQLVITASPTLAKSLAQQIVSHIKETKPHIQEHILFWGRAYDGSMDKKKYPNFKGILQNIKIKNDERQLSAKFRGYLQQFQKNFNQINDQRVEFFEDFDDDALSQSIENDSKIESIIYLNIMELKVARNKLQKQKLTEEALLQQINKLRYFTALKPPSILTDAEKNQYQKELKWARDFLANNEEEMRKNPSLSINQTFNISLDQEKIQIINKRQYQQKRKLKDQPKPNKEIFTDSVDFQDQLKKTNPYESKTSFKSGNNTKVQPYISPIKHLSDPKYNPKLGESLDSDLSIRNDDKKRMQVAKLRSQLQQNIQQEQSQLSDLVVHKYKANPKDSNKKYQQSRPFSVTSQNQFFKKQANSYGGNQFSSPKSPNLPKGSETAKQWKKQQYLSPIRNSRCKLSQFTSNKKQRKQLVPKEKISSPEQYAINPYLIHFQNVLDFTKFRRDCYENNFTIYACPQLVIICSIFKQVNTLIRLQIVFTNNTNFPIEIENIYKIPKCYRIEKKSKISKRFTLHTNLKHVFTLDVEQFPIQACLINLKYQQVHSPSLISATLPLAITILSFVEYLHTSEDEWIQQWRVLGIENNKLFSMIRHLEVDRQVVREQFDWILRDHFVHVGAAEGYSIEDFGSSCYYSALDGLKFLVRLSVRVDNIISLEVRSCRPANENEQDFIRYVMNIWMMLLSKLYF